jgi:hypothetical protein
MSVNVRWKAGRRAKSTFVPGFAALSCGYCVVEVDVMDTYCVAGACSVRGTTVLAIHLSSAAAAGVVAADAAYGAVLRAGFAALNALRQRAAATGRLSLNCDTQCPWSCIVIC